MFFFAKFTLMYPLYVGMSLTTTVGTIFCLNFIHKYISAGRVSVRQTFDYVSDAVCPSVRQSGDGSKVVDSSNLSELLSSTARGKSTPVHILLAYLLFCHVNESRDCLVSPTKKI